MTAELSFKEQLEQSHTCIEAIGKILREQISGVVSVHAAHESNDRRGTDFWCETEGGNHLSVDVKLRSEDWSVKEEPDRADDLALEIWSVMEKQIPGWTRDRSKRTDYVLWYWQDTGRWCLVPFAMLCQVFSESWKSWSQKYKTATQHTPCRGYHSQCVFVPRDIVWSEIYRRFNSAFLEGASDATA
jgi:hypothetical protein